VSITKFKEIIKNERVAQKKKDFFNIEKINDETLAG
jgi:hypothetical protein